MSYLEVIKDLAALTSPKQARILMGFFKTGKGEYGEGDKFIGVKVPQQRIVAKKYKDLKLEEVEKLIQCEIHEHRLTGLFILVHQYSKAKEEERVEIFDLYLKNAKFINNWDLVDSSAPNIVGGYLLDHQDKMRILDKLAKSKDLWERRIAMLATYTFIRKNRFEEAIKIAEILIKDEHDLIQKAVGWMLREIGKRDKQAEIDFLKKYSKVMPRVCLRYAIEKFTEEERKKWMRKDENEV